MRLIDYLLPWRPVRRLIMRVFEQFHALHNDVGNLRSYVSEQLHKVQTQIDLSAEQLKGNLSARASFGSHDVGLQLDEFRAELDARFTAIESLLVPTSSAMREFPQQLNVAANQIKADLSTQASLGSLDLSQQIDEFRAQLQTRFDAIDSLLGPTSIAMGDLPQKLDNAADQIKIDLSTQASLQLHDLSQQVDDFRAQLETRFNAMDILLAPTSDAMRDLPQHLDMAIHQIKGELITQTSLGSHHLSQQIAAFSRELETRFNAVDALLAPTTKVIRDLPKQLDTATSKIKNDILGPRGLQQIVDLRAELQTRLNAIDSLLIPASSAIRDLPKQLDIAAQQIKNDILGPGLHQMDGLRAVFETRFNAMQDLSQKIVGFATDLEARFNTIQSSLIPTSAAVTELPQQFILAVRQIKDDISAPAGLGLQDLSQRIGELRAELEARVQWMTNRLETRLNVVDNFLVPISNGVIELSTGLHSRLNTFENNLLPAIEEQIHENALLQLKQIAAGSSHARDHLPENGGLPKKSAAKSFQSYLSRAKKDFPSVYPAWQERLAAVQSAFDISPIGNAANDLDLYSNCFRYFVEIYAQGPILDVGCGVFGRPFYLQSFPAQAISGIEPLPMKQEADFEVVQGISEYLPWNDETFSTIINATSLDHAISLEKSLAEMIRVLKQDGKLLLWIGSNPGAAPYEPTRKDYVPADRFHLFHFDIAWFEPMLQERFEIVDRLSFRKTSFSHVFYCLRLKQ